MADRYVSTLVVEWIEIIASLSFYGKDSVSTLVVEWIEICQCSLSAFLPLPSPPSWWSGLKYPQAFQCSCHYCLHPRGGVD